MILLPFRGAIRPPGFPYIEHILPAYMVNHTLNLFLGIDRINLLLYNSKVRFADVAHLVERHLAKVEVASSSLVIRSKLCISIATVHSFLFSISYFGV